MTLQHLQNCIFQVNVLLNPQTSWDTALISASLTLSFFIFLTSTRTHTYSVCWKEGKVGIKRMFDSPFCHQGDVKDPTYRMCHLKGMSLFPLVLLPLKASHPSLSFCHLRPKCQWDTLPLPTPQGHTVNVLKCTSLYRCAKPSSAAPLVLKFSKIPADFVLIKSLLKDDIAGCVFLKCRHLGKHAVKPDSEEESPAERLQQ